MFDKDFERYKQLKSMSEEELQEYVEFMELKKQHYKDEMTLIKNTVFEVFGMAVFIIVCFIVYIHFFK